MKLCAVAVRVYQNACYLPHRCISCRMHSLNLLTRDIADQKKNLANNIFHECKFYCLKPDIYSPGHVLSDSLCSWFLMPDSSRKTFLIGWPTKANSIDESE